MSSPTPWIGGTYRGLSTDTKPDHAGLAGWTFEEIDTGDIYYHNGTNWVLIIAGNATAVSLTNKTINVNQNTIKDSTTNAAGDLLKGDGTSYTRLPRGVFNQVLRVDRLCSDVEWGTAYMNMLPNMKKHGYWYGSSTDAWNGFFAGGLTDASTEASATSQWDNTHGEYKQRTTGTSTGDLGGWRYEGLFTSLAFNPRMVAKFSLGQTGTDQRLFIVLTELAASEPGDSDDAYNGESVIGLGLRSTDTIFQWVRNDSAGTTTYANISGSPAVDTNVHTLEIIGDNANQFWRCIFDNDTDNEQTFPVSNSPNTNDRLGIHFFIQTTNASGAKVLNQFWLGIDSDN